MSVFSKSTKGLLVIPATIACLIAGGPASAGTIFSDDFNNGASPLWGNNIGSWHAVGGGGYQASAPSTFPNANSALPFDLADFSVRFDMLRLQDGGVWLRSAPAANGIGRTGVLLVVGGLGGTGHGANGMAATRPYAAADDQSDSGWRFCRRRRMPSVSSPSPRIAAVEGSGTAAVLIAMSSKV